MTQPKNGELPMSSGLELQQLNRRLDKLTDKFDTFSASNNEKLGELHVDVVVIKSQVTEIDSLDKAIRGNGDKKGGLVARVGQLETDRRGKEKLAYLVIACLTSGIVSLAVTFLTKTAM